MRSLVLAIMTTAGFAGCGVETASTAATAGALKQQEIEQGQRTMEQARQKIDVVSQQLQQRADQAADK